MKDTVDQALNAVIRAERRRRLAARLRDGTGLDFDEGIAGQARAWRAG